MDISSSIPAAEASAPHLQTSMPRPPALPHRTLTRRPQSEVPTEESPQVRIERLGRETPSPSSRSSGAKPLSVFSITMSQSFTEYFVSGRLHRHPTDFDQRARSVSQRHPACWPATGFFSRHRQHPTRVRSPSVICGEATPSFFLVGPRMASRLELHRRTRYQVHSG